jgi:LysM repeat protein
MHRDVKLGLALGILVIGFAAAFCFPRQPATEVTMNPAAGLKLAAVDEEIRLERRRTFVGDELTPPCQPTLAEPVAASDINSDLPPLQTAAMRVQEAQRSAPEPIRREVPPPVDDSATIAVTSPDPVDIRVVEPPAEDVYYTVESGDTLSGVASKVLGSSRKYEVLYEANRDILATPNSLRIGMKLRIPQPVESVARRQPMPSAPVAQRSSERAEPASAPASHTTPVDRRGLFSPVRPQQARTGDSIAR